MVDPNLMELDHTHARALGGDRGDRIVCKPCNRSAGATLGNALRANRNRAPARDWYAG
jgi:hypothetical protein